MRRFSYVPLALVLGSVLTLFARPAAGLPLYASREGATCVTCHVDPNGGGIRNEFGFVYDRNRHSTEPEERWSGVTVDPKLNDWITLGLDFRMLYLAEHVNGGISTVSTSTFFPMQGQVNVAIVPHDHLTLVASHGLVTDEPGFPSGYVAREIYGMVEGLPADAYARVGRFRLPFGLRQDDHTSFTRDPEVLTYDAQKPSAGLEIGRIVSRVSAQAAVVNNDMPLSGYSQTVAVKVGWIGKPLQVAISGYHQPDGDLGSISLSSTQGPVTILGEYVRGTTGVANRNREGAFGEIVYRVSRGVNLRAKVDYADAFRNAPGWMKRRYAGEVDWNPIPFAQARLSYRYYDEEGERKRQEYIGMVYFPF